MSQQSNPATLREAMAEIIVDLRRREKRNLNSAHASLRGFAEAAGYAADKLEKVAALAASGTESNPATLREALLQYIEWYGGMHTEECPEDDTCACDFKWINDALNTFLAASGTEAAPSKILDALQRHVTSSESMRETFERTGDAKGASMQAGITAGLLRAIEVVKNSAQAAASPEGEGRETPEEYKFNCKWKLVPSNRPVDGVDPDDVTKEFVYELPGETRVNGNVGAWYQSAVYWKHRALRQSAAPSGGATHSHIDIVKRVLAWHQTAFAIFNAEGRKVIESHDMAIGWASVELAKLLAQESKTGAVTDAQAGRGQPVGSVGLDTQRSTVSGDSASIPESGETGAVTETK